MSRLERKNRKERARLSLAVLWPQLMLITFHNIISCSVSLSMVKMPLNQWLFVCYHLICCGHHWSTSIFNVLAQLKIVHSRYQLTLSVGRHWSPELSWSTLFIWSLWSALVITGQTPALVRHVNYQEKLHNYNIQTQENTVWMGLMMKERGYSGLQ